MFLLRLSERDNSRNSKLHFQNYVLYEKANEQKNGFNFAHKSIIRFIAYSF